MRVKSLLLALGLSLLVGKSFAISFKVDGISYVANADTAIIKGYSEIPENGELTLASTISYGGKDYRVTTIQGSAFLSCTDIKKLIVPANIKYIQSGAFENCVNMDKLVLEEGEERLNAESDAFKNCGIEEVVIGRDLKNSIFRRNIVLTKVVFGNKIKNIPYEAFYGCSNLSSVDLSKVESIGNGAFASTKLENVEIPAQLSYLGTSVFSDCTSLTRVSIKANITSIPDGCFQGCSSLSSVEYPATVTLIGENAFSGCGFTSFKMNENVTEIQRYAFYNCGNLEKIEWGNVSLIGYNAFEGCGFKELSLPNSLCNIYMNAFRGCKNLVKVDLSRTNVTEIGCFANCCALKEVCFPKNLTGIGYECFKGCSSIVSLNLPSTLETLSGGDFQGMSSLAEIDLSDTKIKSLSYDCFKDCSSLQKIVFPPSLESLNSSAFENAIALKEVDLSHTNVHNIPGYCFAGCSSLEQVSLTENTDTIEYQAFAGCSNLAIVKNTDNIKIVYDGAFAKTKLFDGVQNGPAMIGSVLYQYKGTIGDKEYSVPENVTCIAAKALANQKIQSIKLNKGLRYIGTGTFDNCANLLSLTVPSSVEYIGSSTGCSSLSSLTLKEGDKNLELGAFSDNKIKKIYMGRNVSSQLDWMPELENLTIGKYVKSIGSDFSSSEKLTNLELEDADDVLDFGNNPMVGRVTSLYMGRNVRVNYGMIANSAEYEANSFKNLTDITIGDRIESICKFLCFKNQVMRELIIPGTVKNIEPYAFCGLPYLKKLILSEGIEKIEDHAFGFGDFGVWYNNRKVDMDELIIPSSVKSIGENAFVGIGCKHLVLPDNVLIGLDAFYAIDTDSLVLPRIFYGSTFNSGWFTYLDLHNCTNQFLKEGYLWNCWRLREIILPAHLETMDYATFRECSSLESVVCLSNDILEITGEKIYNGKIFVLPGSQLPEEDVTCMYTVNKLNYEQSADGKVLFDGINNMSYDITPIFYQNGEEVELKEAGVYDLSMKISGTTYDGIYPTGLKVTVTSSTGINNVTMDSNASNCPIYNMNGQRVDGSYKGVVIQNGKKRLAK